MQAEVLENGDLKISVTPEERAILGEMEDRHTDVDLHDFFEGLIANSEYEWVLPEYCGALTDAPMLGIYGPERELREGENLDFLCLVGGWEDKTWVQDVVKCWAFMNYQIDSVLEVLFQSGSIIFDAGQEVG